MNYEKYKMVTGGSPSKVTNNDQSADPDPGVTAENGTPVLEFPFLFQTPVVKEMWGTMSCCANACSSLLRSMNDMERAQEKAQHVNTFLQLSITGTGGIDRVAMCSGSQPSLLKWL